LPKLITTVLPIAAFSATAYVTNRMNNESELTVIQATGSGPFRMMQPILVFGVIVFAMSSVLHHLLMPLAQQQLNERESEITQNATARLLTEGRFLHPSKGVTFYTQEIDEDGVLNNVFLSDGRRKSEGIIYTAEQAYLIRDGARTSLIMINGMLQRLSENDDRISTASFRDFSFDISALVQNAQSEKPHPDRMTTWELMQPWDKLAEETGRSLGYITYDFHTRFAEPLFCIAAALVGFSFVLVGGYSRFGVWREVAFGFALLVAMDGARSTLQNPVRSDPNLWPSLYFPSAFSVMLALFLLWISARPQGAVFRWRQRPA
jgi:lipopolysaccharide export system permease protein